MSRRRAFNVWIRACGMCLLCTWIFAPSHCALGKSLGANKYDLALQYLPPSSDNDRVDQSGYIYVRRAMAKKAIADARDAGLSFLRVAVTGFWPVSIGDSRSDLELWRHNPDLFWKSMDEMFDDLDGASVRIVPVFVWNPTQFPALARQPVSELIRNSGSESRN